MDRINQIDSSPEGITPSDSGSVISSSTSASSTSTRYVAPALRRSKKTAQYVALQQQAYLDAQTAKWDMEELERKQAKTLGPKLPQFNLPFFLSKDKMAFLTARYPRTTFRCTSDNNHDHPLAHTETMIACSKAYRLIPAGNTVIDYFGSVNAMRDFNKSQAKSHKPKRGLAYIDYLSPKAFIRHRNVGPVNRPDGTANYVVHNEGPKLDMEFTDNTITFGKEVVQGDTLTWYLKHTLYYMSDEQIQDCLNVKGSSMVAIIHRHPNDNGTLFDGECTYAKRGGTVQQTNKLTGENYVHNDLSWLWDSNSKVRYTSSGAFTWTFHMISADTWIIELVACPTSVDERFAKRAVDLGINGAAAELNDHSVVPTSYAHPHLADLPSSSCVLVGGVPIIMFDNDVLPNCRLTNPELYEFLATTVVGKPRDADRLQDLFSLARTQVQQASEFPGKKNFSCSSADIASHVVLAFLTGLSKESQLLRAVAAYNGVKKEHGALLDGVAVAAGSGPATAMSSMVFAAKRINQGRKQKSTFDAILSVVEN